MRPSPCADAPALAVLLPSLLDEATITLLCTLRCWLWATAIIHHQTRKVARIGCICVCEVEPYFVHIKTGVSRRSDCHNDKILVDFPLPSADIKLLKNRVGSFKNSAGEPTNHPTRPTNAVQSSINPPTARSFCCSNRPGTGEGLLPAE
jgi:hypothetical protein